MPKRSEKSAKFRRWCLYFPAKQDKGRVSQSLNALRALVNKGRAGVVYHEVSARRVDLEWPYPVGWDSATRLCSLALKACPTFRLLGEPHGIQSDEGADAQRAEETPETCGEEPPKRRRGAPKKEPPAASAGAESAETASAGADSAGAASAGAASAVAASAGAASAVAASAGAAAAEPGGDSPAAPGLPEPSPAPPAVSVEPAPTAWSTWVAPTAVAVEPRLLGIKLEHLGARFIHGWFGGYNFGVYDVAWDDWLGAGAASKVFAARSPREEEVAVKIFNDGPQGDIVATADAEVVRLTAAGFHPNLVPLLDVGLFIRRGFPKVSTPAVGLVYERFDGNLSKILQLPLKLDGVTHVLRSVLAGLAHMHAAGLVHTDVKPENILLRGTGSHRRAWARRLAPGPARAAAASAPDLDEAPAFAAHLPGTFEVRGNPPPSARRRLFPQGSPLEPARSKDHTV